MMKRVFAVGLLVALVAGCGSKKADETPTVTNVLPDARTPDEWAMRIVNRYLRPLNKDLTVVSSFNNPQIRLYIASRNPTTLRIIDQRLNDLKKCNAKLIQIGPPPAGHPQLTTISFHFRRACDEYEVVAEKLLKASEFLASGRTDVISRGEDIARSARDPSGRAANEFTAGIKIAQKRPEFRRAGLKPSV